MNQFSFAALVVSPLTHTALAYSWLPTNALWKGYFDLRWLSPHLDDFPPVNINFVMSMTPTGLQVW